MPACPGAPDLDDGLGLGCHSSACRGPGMRCAQERQAGWSGQPQGAGCAQTMSAEEVRMEVTPPTGSFLGPTSLLQPSVITSWLLTLHCPVCAATCCPGFLPRTYIQCTRLNHITVWFNHLRLLTNFICIFPPTTVPTLEVW